MLCDCSLQILNNFIFEFVFYKRRPSGQWSTCWGLGAWLPWTPASPRWVLCYMLSTPRSPGPSPSLQPLLPSTWASTRWGHFLDSNIRKVRVGHLVTPAGASTACSVGSWLCVGGWLSPTPDPVTIVPQHEDGSLPSGSLVCPGLGLWIPRRGDHLVGKSE